MHININIKDVSEGLFAYGTFIKTSIYGTCTEHYITNNNFLGVPGHTIKTVSFTGDKQDIQVVYSL